MKLYEYNAFVDRVIDGDTINFHIDLGFNIIAMNQELRLAGINAPEIRGDSKEAGEKSKEYLKGRVEGKTVVLQSKKPLLPKEKYGRWLAIIFLDGVNINQELVQLGFAVPYMADKV